MAKRTEASAAAWAGKPSLRSREVPHTIWAQSVQPFRRLLHTNKQTDTQTDKPTLYIDRDLGIPIEKLSRRHFINTFDVLEVL